MLQEAGARLAASSKDRADSSKVGDPWAAEISREVTVQEAAAFYTGGVSSAGPIDHSITSSARASTGRGIAADRAPSGAVLRLTMSSNFVALLDGSIRGARALPGSGRRTSPRAGTGRPGSPRRRAGHRRRRTSRDAVDCGSRRSRAKATMRQLDERGRVEASRAGPSARPWPMAAEAASKSPGPWTSTAMVATPRARAASSVSRISSRSVGFAGLPTSATRVSVGTISLRI